MVENIESAPNACCRKTL